MSLISERKRFSPSTSANIRMSSIMVNDEIEWGVTFRNLKQRARKKSVLPTGSPLNIATMIQMYQLREAEKHWRKKAKGRKKKTKAKAPVQINRDVASQRVYDNYLAIPRGYPRLKRRKKARPPSLDPLSPRLVQLAVPNKTRVLAHWKDFQNFLETDFICRLKDILYTDQNLDPEAARRYFKNLDKKKRRLKRKKRRMLAKKERDKQRGDVMWIKEQIVITADLIVKFIKNEPLFTLNYKQMMFSDMILTVFERRGELVKPNRNTTNAYKKTILEISDQLSVWSDTLIRYVDIQTVESREELPLVGLPSLLSLGEEEEEEESEETIESSESSGGLIAEEGEEFGEQGDEFGKHDEGQGEGEAGKGLSLLDMLGQLGESGLDIDEDLLEKLIKILSESSPEFLAGLVDPDALPDVTYQMVLDRLILLRDGKEFGKKNKRRLVLEETMIEWAKKNEPDQVDGKLVDKIRSTAVLLADWLFEEYAESLASRPHTGFGEDDGEDFGASFGAGGGADSGADADVGADADGGFGGEDGEDTTREFSMDATTSVEEPQKDDKMVQDIDEDWKSVEELPEDGQPGAPCPWPEPFPECKIVGHKPPTTTEHKPDMVCCLSLKIWAIWLLEVANNAHAWSKWLIDIIHEVRGFAAIIRGEVKNDDGTVKVLYKEDWKNFSEKVDNMIVSWRQYSMHVGDLTDRIVEHFHGKKVACCPACLEDQLIVNVVAAHDITQQLAEAMSTAQYWRRWLDGIVKQTERLMSVQIPGEDERASTSIESESSVMMEIVELYVPTKPIQEVESEESFWEIEELDPY